MRMGRWVRWGTLVKELEVLLCPFPLGNCKSCPAECNVINQVKDSLESLNINKTTGCDGIPGKVLTIGAKELAKPLVTLFNTCINNRVWPSEWKCVELASIFKKNDRHRKENYRPITVLPCVSKVFEQFVG